jgi:cell division protein FtsB
MGNILQERHVSDAVKEAARLRTEIDRLEQKLARLVAGVPLHKFARNDYLLSAADMKKIASNLHAEAQAKIAGGESREFRGSIEDIL